MFQGFAVNDAKREHETTPHSRNVERKQNEGRLIGRTSLIEKKTKKGQKQQRHLLENLQTGTRSSRERGYGPIPDGAISLALALLRIFLALRFALYSPTSQVDNDRFKTNTATISMMPRVTIVLPEIINEPNLWTARFEG